MVGNHNVALTKGATIIIGRKGSVGAVHYSPAACWPIDTTYFIDEFNGLDPTYLGHVLRSLDLAELDTSTAIPGLNRDDIYAQPVPLPPLADQKRIVARVEALLARVNAARQRLAKVPAILKRFRQSVLAAACSGGLTADWREQKPDTPPAATLLELIRSQKSNRASSNQPLPELEGLPATWSSARFEELTENHDGKRIPVKADDRAKRRGKYPYYGASGIIDTIDATPTSFRREVASPLNTWRYLLTGSTYRTM